MEIHRLFGASGPFSKILDNYKPRNGQLEMASLVEQAISSNKHLVVEAPSGLGKTFAYLVPALIAGKKTIVSTSTQYLQNQLYQNDIPVIKRALDNNCRVAVLKGRSNYLCPYYLEKSLSGDTAIVKSIRMQLIELWQKFRLSSDREWSELLSTLDSTTLSYATCDSEECLGKHCPQFLNCPYIRARDQAKRADLLIVNHSLLFSGQVLRREQYSDLLPKAGVVIVDEAHRLAEFAQTIIGHWLSSRQLKAFCRDAIKIVTELAPEQLFIRDFLRRLEKVVSQLGKSLPTTHKYNKVVHVGIVNQLEQALNQISGWLQGATERGQQLCELDIRTQQLAAKLRKIQLTPGLCWVKPTSQGFVLQNIPVNVASTMEMLFAQDGANWIFTSATLSVANNADKFLHLLGLSPEHFHQVDSSVDYSTNAGLYTPKLAVEPNHPSYFFHLTEHVLELLECAQGKVLFLFTSYEMLKKTATQLMGKSETPLFIQGSVQNSLLIEQFKRSKNGVLLGTGSFWEGFDLSGVPLVSVIIDKLPFASPEDPLVKLRADNLTATGVDCFQNYLLPDAVIRLRQGCGRLLRRLSDKGVIMIADPRLHSKSYGAVFVSSLPAMSRSNHLAPLKHLLHRPSVIDSDRQLDTNETISN